MSTTFVTPQTTGFQDTDAAMRGGDEITYRESGRMAAMVGVSPSTFSPGRSLWNQEYEGGDAVPGQPVGEPPPAPPQQQQKKKIVYRNRGGGGNGVNIPNTPIPDLFSQLPKPTQAATATSSGGSSSWLLIIGAVVVGVIIWWWWRKHKGGHASGSAPPHPAD